MVEGDGGTKIGFTQIAGLVARRILRFVKEGQRVSNGERIGLIRFGSRVDVYLPAGTGSRLLLGQRAIERLVIQQGIARPGRPPEAAAFHEDVVGAALEMIGLVVLGKTRRHRRADAGADKDIEHDAALAERPGTRS